MDVDQYNFTAVLPTIVSAIARSRFVAIDLELSGIPRYSALRNLDRSPQDEGKQSLQQRYSETKAAAERFQILQLGLTCIEEDLEKGTYVARPYNIYVSPQIDKRLKLERESAFQSGAVDFLLSHQFKIDAPFLRGVPRLSWTEEAQARAIAAADWTRDSLADISIESDDVENLALMRKVRQDIDAWLSQTSPQPDHLNITPEKSDERRFSGKGLNRYQKRLVHQLVRAEYAGLVSISRPESINVMRYDKIREQSLLERKKRGLDKTLTQQIGLRWIIEIICNNIKSVLPDKHWSPMSSFQVVNDLIMDQPSLETTATKEHMKEHNATLQALLQQSPMIVGHNLFLDLIYLFACFFGPLPDLVEDFTANLAKLFPLIVDTKYVADTLNKNKFNFKSSLEDLDAELSKFQSPTIDIPPKFEKYSGNSKLHEAGFDSFLAARSLIRLSAKVDGLQATGPSMIATTGANLSSTNCKAFKECQAPNLTEDHKHLLSTNPPESDSDRFREMTLNEPQQDTAPSMSGKRVMMPSKDSNFWTQYGNSLRVNGTVEGYCRITTTQSSQVHLTDLSAL